MFNGKYDNIDVVMEHEKSVQKTQQQQRELNKREESVCIPLTNRYIELRGRSTTRIFPKKKPLECRRTFNTTVSTAKEDVGRKLKMSAIIFPPIEMESYFLLLCWRVDTIFKIQWFYYT